MDAQITAKQAQGRLDWPMIVRVRLAIHDLRACQSQLFQHKPPCFAALIDARNRIDEAIEGARSEMERVANG